MSYMRRLSPLESTYTKERATEVCLATLQRARLRPRRGDEHQARPRRPSAEGAARLRDRERPAERRPPDHPRPGRPARLPGVPARGRPRAPLRRRRPVAADRVPPPRARPRADRDLLLHRRGDLAASPSGTPATSASPTSEAAENAEATIFLEAILFRRYEAKLRYELDFWCRFAEVGGIARRLRGVPHRRDRHPLPPHAATSPTWTPASTRPTTSAPGSARPSSAAT